MASHETSRKKRKVSHMEGHPSQPYENNITASSSALPHPINTTAMASKTANAPCSHEQTLKALNTDLDAMRQLITCKICDRLLYEPYALSCGHTYCYSCLSQWLSTNPRMTCPDCRIVIRQQPNPSYLIRELVLIFVSRNELLPDGETAEEHNKLVREEAEIVARDKANTDHRTGGLFKGRFNKSRLNLIGPLHDPGDGVERCPQCHWELEEGHCGQCGFEADDLDDDYLSLEESEDNSGMSDEDVDLELGDMDGGDVFAGAEGPDDWGFGQERYVVDGTNDVHTHPRRWPQYPVPAGARPGPIDLHAHSDEELESEEDEYDRDDTFIDDGTILEEEEDDEEGSDAESDVTAGRQPAQQVQRRNFRGRAGPVVISDDEDDEDDPAPVTSRGRHGGGRSAPVAISEDGSLDEDETAPSTTLGADGSDSDSEDEGPVVRGSQRMKRPDVAVRSRRTVTVSSDEESAESDNDGSESNAPGGFSPLDDGYGEEASEQTDYDDFDDVDGGGQGGMGTSDSFMPYEEDPGSSQFYESDDGWGTTMNTRRQAAPALRPLARPQARQSTASQYRFSPPTLSPPVSLRAHQSPPQLNQPRPRPANPYAQPARPINYDHTTTYHFPDQRNHDQAAPNHPFQLDSTLSRINNTSVGPSGNYNQRSQQARTHPYQRTVPIGSGNNHTYPSGVALQPGRTSGSRPTTGFTSDVRRKRGLSVESDDSQEYYV